jgi:hypothetical protein
MIRLIYGVDAQPQADFLHSRARPFGILCVTMYRAPSFLAIRTLTKLKASVVRFSMHHDLATCLPPSGESGCERFSKTPLARTTPSGEVCSVILDL